MRNFDLFGHKEIQAMDTEGLPQIDEIIPATNWVAIIRRPDDESLEEWPIACWARIRFVLSDRKTNVWKVCGMVDIHGTGFLQTVEDVFNMFQKESETDGGITPDGGWEFIRYSAKHKA